ncbi:MAG: preprotein translocase subunit YajC [Planctomycetales bacterium]|nr:preprotein translocase subunit YajC [Planctomycetales bacterium]
MNSMWMLAAAETPSNGESETITMEESTGTQQAVTTQDGSVPPTNVPAKQPPNPWMQFLPIILIFVVMYFFMFRGPKKKQQEHQKMVDSLQKNDRIRTIGGIFGTVLDVREDEIVLKIDESTNTKMRVSPAAIAAVLKDKTE